MTWTSAAIGGRTVRTWRSGAGAPLLFLHGFLGHPGPAPFLATLAQGRDVVAPEHPGYGESATGEEARDVLDMVLHYRQLAEGLGGGPVDVIGHSLGAMFAAELAAICPQVVRRLVLVAPFGLWLEEAPIPDLFVMNEAGLARATWANPEAGTAANAAQGATGGGNGAGQASDRIATVIRRAADLATAGRFLWPIPDCGLSRRISLVRAPTLIVTGSEDRLIPPVYGEAFAARIAGARHLTIAGAGHYPMLEQPGRFLAEVEEFLGASGG